MLINEGIIVVAGNSFRAFFCLDRVLVWRAYRTEEFALMVNILVTYRLSPPRRRGTLAIFAMRKLGGQHLLKFPYAALALVR